VGQPFTWGRWRGRRGWCGFFRGFRFRFYTSMGSNKPVTIILLLVGLMIIH